MKKSIDKLLLVNHVRHANAHNKIKEEQEMWKARETELVASRSANMNKHSPLVRGRLVSDSMDSPDRSHSPSSTYWSRQLMKVEENDPYRWGHSGYKDMYPEEFVSGSEDDESSGPSARHHKKQKRKRSVSSDTNSSSKKSKKLKREKHKRSHSSHKSKHKHKKKKAK